MKLLKVLDVLRLSFEPLEGKWKFFLNVGDREFAYGNTIAFGPYVDLATAMQASLMLFELEVYDLKFLLAASGQEVQDEDS